MEGQNGKVNDLQSAIALDTYRGTINFQKHRDIIRRELGLIQPRDKSANPGGRKRTRQELAEQRAIAVQAARQAVRDDDVHRQQRQYVHAQN